MKPKTKKQLKNLLSSVNFALTRDDNRSLESLNIQLHLAIQNYLKNNPKIIDSK